MHLVTIETTQSLVHAGGRPVVGSAAEMRGGRRVALLTQPLPRIGRDADGATVGRVDLRHREPSRGEIRVLAAIKEVRWLRVFGRCVDLMASEARDRGMCRLALVLEGPGAGLVQRRNQIRHSSGEIHTVAAEAVVGRLFHLVMLGVEEEPAIGRRVPAGLPLGEVLRMAGAA